MSSDFVRRQAFINGSFNVPPFSIEPIQVDPLAARNGNRVLNASRKRTYRDQDTLRINCKEKLKVNYIVTCTKRKQEWYEFD